MIAVDVIFQPPTRPAEAVIVPLPLTLKLDEDMKKSLVPADPLKKNPVPDIASDERVNPPTLPPVNKTFEPVTCPFALTLKLDADIKNPSPVAEPLRKKPLPVIAS